MDRIAVMSRPVQGCPRVTPQAARALAKTWRRDLGDAVWTELCVGGDWLRGLRLNQVVEMHRHDHDRPDDAALLQSSTTEYGTPPIPAKVPQAAAIEIDSLRHGMLRGRDQFESKLQSETFMEIPGGASLERAGSHLQSSKYIALAASPFLAATIESLASLHRDTPEVWMDVERGIAVACSDGRLRAGILVHTSVLQLRTSRELVDNLEAGLVSVSRDSGDKAHSGYHMQQLPMAVLGRDGCSNGGSFRS